ncbi:hypothetical protein Tco_0481793 [Tanacetum coccineum]
MPLAKIQPKQKILKVKKAKMNDNEVYRHVYNVAVTVEDMKKHIDSSLIQFQRDNGEQPTVKVADESSHIASTAKRRKGIPQRAPLL